MPISMRHLLASSAVAGLLVLLPVGDANAQDNRNTWDWGTAGGVMLSFIAIAAAGGAVGGSSIVAWQLSKLASKGKRDDEAAMELALTQLNSSVKALDEKLTNLEAKSEENFQSLSSALESAVNKGNHEKLPLPRINKDPLAWADEELMKIERKVREMEIKIKRIPGDELMSTGDAVRHLLHVEVKEAVEKIISITGISDSQIPPYPGILDNMSIAKRWLKNTREVLDMHNPSKPSRKQVKSYERNNVNRNPNMPDQDYGLDPQNPWEISKG